MFLALLFMDHVFCYALCQQANTFGYDTRIMEPQTEWRFSVPELERYSNIVFCVKNLKSKEDLT